MSEARRDMGTNHDRREAWASWYAEMIKVVHPNVNQRQEAEVQGTKVTSMTGGWKPATLAQMTDMEAFRYCVALGIPAPPNIGRVAQDALSDMAKVILGQEAKIKQLQEKFDQAKLDQALADAAQFALRQVKRLE